MRPFIQSKKVIISVFILVVIVAAVIIQLVSLNQSKEQPVQQLKQEISTESASSAISNLSSSSSTPKPKKHAFIGNWSGSNISFSFKENGTYTFQNENYQANGSYLIAGEYDDIILIKLSYFKEHAGETYLYMRFNDNDTKVSIDNLGTFTRSTDVMEVNTSYYMVNSLRSPPQYASESLIGTWSRVSNDGQVVAYLNYNPDGSFEQFDSKMVKVKSGKFSVNIQKKSIIVLESFDDGSQSVQTPYSTNSSFSILTSLSATSNQDNTVSYKNSLPDKLN